MTAVVTRDISGLIAAWGEGDEQVLRSLMPAVYPELRRIARQHQNIFRTAKRTSRDEHRVTRAALRLLQNCFRAQRLDDGGHFCRLMPYDNIYLANAEAFAREHGLLDQRAAASTVQHLREIRLQPRTFARCENNDGKILIRHRSGFSLGRACNAMRGRSALDANTTRGKCAPVRAEPALPSPWLHLESKTVAEKTFQTRGS